MVDRIMIDLTLFRYSVSVSTLQSYAAFSPCVIYKFVGGFITSEKL